MSSASRISSGASSSRHRTTACWSAKFQRGAARRSSSRGRSRRAGSDKLVERVDSRSRDWRAGQRATVWTLLRSREDRRIVSSAPADGVSMCPGVVINFAAGHLGWCTFDGRLRSHPGRSSTLYREPVSWPFCSDGTGRFVSRQLPPEAVRIVESSRCGPGVSSYVAGDSTI